MVEVKAFVEKAGSRFIGPNCRGFIAQKEAVGEIYKSSTLTHETVH